MTNSSLEPVAQSKRLIVNADDYGLTASVSAGIRQAHRHGIVTSTTALMNMPGVEAELRTARAECPKLGLGVHLVLTSGRPVLPPERVTSLLGIFRDGDREAWVERIDAVRHFKFDELRAEWRAQVDKFVRAAGRAPDHLDSHHHIAYVTPEVCEVLLGLAREFGCAIRTPLAGAADPGDLFDYLPDDLRARAKHVPAMLRAAHDVPQPDYFEARFYDQAATPELLRAIITGLPGGVSELMCHPGLLDPALEAMSSYAIPRAQELALLTNGEWRRLLAAQQIELITFGELHRP